MHWILLRGLTREQAHWGSFATRLRDAFPDDRFHTVDLPGTGVRYREDSPARVAGICKKVREQVRHVPGPLNILALSMGGMVALDWAQNAMEGEIQNLILINTSSGFSPPWQRMRPGAWPWILRLLGRRELFDRERDLLRLTSNREVPLTLAKQWYSIQRQRPVSSRNAIRQLTAAARYTPAQKRPLADALVLASRGDRIVHWRCSAALEARWQWTLKLHPDAGHDLPLDEPDWIIQQIRNWLPR
ncbi:alpha/beta fold hydrolase [Marinobacter subterrani]|uniref:Pimeloyl-ACP methyl ester carboxylesterase n=1 Tax=Marinobacter subterrani TaxID=1658765 RepID=A0A0J7JFB1_9GAMM|nr:alpha/beta hydrolase [Marinobacter subterrani]KMQ76574.1 Pimeloyl-ACP methyl ester carboxylesterase [Marinobacter subterrani]